MKMKNIPINQIKPNPNQPRKFFDEPKLKELADSIKNKGLLEEILVRPKNNYFEIVHGERRWGACKLLGWKTIRAKIQVMPDEEAFELSLIENIQRENLLPIEEAEAYLKLANSGLTHEEIAKKVNKSRTYITQKLRILKLPYSVQRLLKSGILSEGHSRQLLRLEDIIGRHENLDKVKSPWKDLLNGGKYPFKSWVAYYQDYFAWSVVQREKLSVEELKERIDKFYFDIVCALIFKDLSYNKEEMHKVLEKKRKGLSLTRYEITLYCRWFEETLRQKLGLSGDNIAEKDWKFWISYSNKYGYFRGEPEE